MDRMITESLLYYTESNKQSERLFIPKSDKIEI